MGENQFVGEIARSIFCTKVINHLLGPSVEARVVPQLDKRISMSGALNEVRHMGA